MFHPLDIFKSDPDGSVLWLGAAEDFVAAKAYIEKLARSSLGEYLILDQVTGHKVCVSMGISTLAAEDELTTTTATA